ncbi:MAG TPA: helix-turn-helix domain-containing protein [Herpetosiphonaceae bacterium]
MDKHPTTHQAILASALSLMQARGYHAWSYADIAKEIGIQKASIHYYFPSKQDLAQAVVAGYRAASRAGFAQLQQTIADPALQLAAYIAYFGEEVDGQPRMCLCALLAAEMLTLPDPVRVEVQGYYQEHEAWLAQALAAGQQAGTLQFSGAAAITAQTLLATLEGAMLAARAYGQRERYLHISAHLIQQLQEPR